MAKTQKKPNEPGLPQVSPVKGIELIRKQIEAGEQILKNRPIPDDTYNSWCLLTRNYLEKAFGVNSPNVKNVMEEGRLFIIPDESDAWWANHRIETLRSQIATMKSLIILLETEAELSKDEAPATKSAMVFSHKIFLVHGHNEAILHETARFLEKLNQEVIILREQPNKGKTIIEKIENYSDVGFAVVLLTPDDVGGVKDAADLKPRARQNVIFELGYFIGRLGRERVCALYSPGVEILSDYSGVLYQELDKKGSWRLELAKELRAAGYLIDMNMAV